MTIDQKRMAHARECVRLAALTDDELVREQLLALAHDWVAAAMKEEEEEDDDDSTRDLAVLRRQRVDMREEDDYGEVLIFPSRRRAPNAR